MNLEVVILAAGQGTRMHSRRPKVLHELAGRPLLAHVIDRARALAPAAVHVVYGHGAQAVRRAFPETAVHWVLQAAQQGTGHALAQALPDVATDAVVLVLYGDVPLVAAPTLAALTEAARPGRLALLAVELERPDGYGRIVRNARGDVTGIVEQADADAAQRAIREVNTGLMAAPAALFRRWLGRLARANAQGEYYLTDVVAMAVQERIRIEVCRPGSTWEALGVNSRKELAILERIVQNEQASKLLEQGVTLRDPNRFDLRGELEAGRDVEIDINVILEGKIRLGDGVRIGANTTIRDSEIGPGTRVRENCVIEGARVGADCVIGPFARIRPGTRLAPRTHIGNFVELKNSQTGTGTKINHLSYVGDCTVGAGVNIGAGVITCNYDGANKHRTVIGDDAFIGSGTQLVAPLTVGRGATIGAGSTITRDTPPGELTLARARQQTVPGWQRPKKKK